MTYLSKEDGTEISEMFLRLQSQAKKLQISKDQIIKDIRSIRRKLYMETFRED